MRPYDTKPLSTTEFRLYKIILETRKEAMHRKPIATLATRNTNAFKRQCLPISIKLRREIILAKRLNRATICSRCSVRAQSRFLNESST
ncbi:hypothetical protein BpHYR1_016129 [Brachionus plicatilis]|uniref:Uncharacterized protein n=1 Tax=Brachionus plicatilis TaxID=10195 RepID=A0A3M7QQD5_BRAPC|nr:hypothetical protein BpHYR1_016129 [Brachionus plicatilis]